MPDPVKTTKVVQKKKKRKKAVVRKVATPPSSLQRRLTQGGMPPRGVAPRELPRQGIASENYSRWLKKPASSDFPLGMTNQDVVDLRSGTHPLAKVQAKGTKKRVKRKKKKLRRKKK